MNQDWYRDQLVCKLAALEARLEERDKELAELQESIETLRKELEEEKRKGVLRDLIF